ncbi:Bacterial alpha-L-rhamnosidase [Pirellulimonas nuda]|uniref:alpha-L-rhamnosidase n=1 Tax=Pirellulimonas nuda TaxID=2528009 RepID=A0A518DG02_9BACT|nr:family 78 glycoside hydrolase catalytic domain [Pirellulimonas nuda]QDU90398.1 Bacterial alpha-L-rhamnosidase [Pirellulimonas nuda]
MNSVSLLLTTSCLFAGLHAAGGAQAGAQAADWRVEGLRCDFSVDPLGVDSSHPRLSWRLQSSLRAQRQSAWRVLVATSRDRLDEEQGDLWDSGKQASEESLHHPYDGAPLCSSQQVFWKVRAWDQDDRPSPWSQSATWTMGVLDADEWRGEWIVAPWQTESLLVRNDFEVDKDLKRAIVHVCGLGHFEMTLNGVKSGKGLLAPGWTKYNKTCLYETHDVTALLRQGKNAIGVALGDGMHHTERRNRFSKFQNTFGPQRLIAQIELEYADGRREIVATDASWRVDPGPTTYNDIFGGEDFDARRVEPGWDTAGFDESHWANAVPLVRPSGELRGSSLSALPITAIETKPPVAVKRLSPTRDVVDFGQNTSYMPRIRVTGKAGGVVRLTHAEVVHDDGTINRDTCGGNRGPAYWQYTKATDDEETWFPRFFYAGCRYLQVDKSPAEPGDEPPELAGIEGVVVHSTAEPIGEFACSNELLDRIRTLVRWAQRSNMVSVLTDCPHREKLGWLEQYHLNGPGVRYEFDASRIFVKSMRDMADCQLESGLVPNIAPEYVEFPGTFRAAAEWGSAVILVPWQHYQATGDERLLREYYGVMQRYLAYLGSKASGHIVEEGLGDWYDMTEGERPGVSKLTPPPFTATAFYYLDAKTMAQIAQLLGNHADAATFSEVAEEIRSAWLAKFRTTEGGYGTGSQCSNAIALVMGLALPDDRGSILEALVRDVRAHGNAPTAGDVGFRYVLQALAQNGRSDVIYDMVNQQDRPGYGYQLKQGATALTEGWDANTQASHNHFMLGHITEWFYKDLVGIGCDPAGPGYKRIYIKPSPVGDLKWAEATHHCVRGPIHVRWQRDAERLVLEVDVPANTTATVFVPADSAESVLESGTPASSSHGVTLVRIEGDRVLFEVGSGSYHFEVARGR